VLLDEHVQDGAAVRQAVLEDEPVDRVDDGALVFAVVLAEVLPEGPVEVAREAAALRECDQVALQVADPRDKLRARVNTDKFRARGSGWRSRRPAAALGQRRPAVGA